MADIGGPNRENAVPSLSFFEDTYAITSALILTIVHGLPKTPRMVWLRIKCLTAELGYAVGDEIELASSTQSGTNTLTVASNKTQIKVVFQTLPAVTNFSSNAEAQITANNWQLHVKAEV